MSTMRLMRGLNIYEDGGFKMKEEEKCACKGSYLDKFIQPALLVLLKDGDSHGFKLINDLEESGMVSGDSIDSAGLYRSLKKMENIGLVVSNWDTENFIKPRRIYKITDQGRACLAVWKDTLKAYKKNLEKILERIDE